MIISVTLLFFKELLRDAPSWWGRGAIAAAVLIVSFIAVMMNLR